jgi:riboflavin biosynthesis pyrimidine reductase
LIQSANEIPTWIFVNDGVDSLWKNNIEQQGVRVIELPATTKRVSLKQVLDYLGQAEIDEVFIEPGRRLLQSLIHEKWINQWLVFESPNIEPDDQLDFLAYDYKISTHFQQLREEQVGEDTLRVFAPKEE